MKFTSVVLLCAALAACTPTVDHRGYLARPGAFDSVREGMAKSEVEAALGSPSTTASINFQGDSYYYISSKTEQTAFFTPTETQREIIAVRFDQNDAVTSIAQYGLEDGKVIDINSRRTPTRGRELNVLEQLFGNIGKGNPLAVGG